MSTETATTSGSAGHAPRGRRGLSIAGQVLIVLGIGMAAMPFVGSLVGLPLDGAATWVVDLNRVVLHVLPGVAAVALGAMLVRAQRARERDGEAPAWVPQVLVAVGVLGVWYAAGPWLLEAVLPPSMEGRMFLGIPGFESFSTAHQLTLEAVCHWIPGAICLAAGAAAAMVIRRRSPQSAVTAA